MSLPRIELTALLEGRVVETLTRQGPELSCLIGRADECDLRLIGEGVSRRHCKVFAQTGGLVLEDLGSANGTFVVGHRVTRRALVGTGEFAVCGFTVRYKAEAAGREAPVGLLVESRRGFADRTMQIVPERVRQNERRSVVRAALRGHLVGAPPAGLKTEGRVILLHKGTSVIGSSDRSEVVVAGAPRMAALILRGDATFEVLDVSEKGKSVRVNGERRLTAPLFDEDELEVCGEKFLFRDGLPRLDDPPTKRWVRTAI